DFAQIRERVPGISDPMLARRLQELTEIDLVAQDVRPGLESRISYTLSPHGKAFLIPLAILFLWAEDHLPASGSSPSDQPAGPGHCPPFPHRGRGLELDTCLRPASGRHRGRKGAPFSTAAERGSPVALLTSAGSDRARGSGGLGSQAQAVDRP